MATYRVTGDPRNPNILQRVVDLLRHLDGFGIVKTAVSAKLTGGGYVDISTDLELPNGQATHIGVEEI